MASIVVFVTHSQVNVIELLLCDFRNLFRKRDHWYWSFSGMPARRSFPRRVVTPKYTGDYVLFWILRFRDTFSVTFLLIAVIRESKAFEYILRANIVFIDGSQTLKGMPLPLIFFFERKTYHSTLRENDSPHDMRAAESGGIFFRLLVHINTHQLP